jgi:SAM-dependent methyltransferase
MCLSPRLNYDSRPAIKLDPDQLEARDRVQDKLKTGTYQLEDVPCFCGADEAQLLARRDRYGLPVNTLLCNRCGLLRTSPRMTREASNRFYAEDYRALYVGSHKKNEALLGQSRSCSMLPIYKKLLPPPATLFEVGCGAGGLFPPLVEAGYQIAGCDLDVDAAALGRSKGFDTVHGNATRLKSEFGEAADGLILSHVVEHFLDLREELKEVSDALHPGGLLFITVPGVRNIAPSYGGNILSYLQNAHTYHFTASTLRFVLESSGLITHFVDEQCVAIAEKPSRAGQRILPTFPTGETTRTLNYLRALERRLEYRSRATPVSTRPHQGLESRPHSPLP